jgi:hypothetical protein
MNASRERDQGRKTVEKLPVKATLCYFPSIEKSPVWKFAIADEN